MKIGPFDKLTITQAARDWLSLFDFAQSLEPVETASVLQNKSTSELDGTCPSTLLAQVRYSLKNSFVEPLVTSVAVRSIDRQ